MEVIKLKKESNSVLFIYFMSASKFKMNLSYGNAVLIFVPCWQAGMAMCLTDKLKGYAVTLDAIMMICVITASMAM